MTDSPRPDSDATIPMRAIRAIGPVRAAMIIFGFLLLVVLASVGLGYRAGLAKHAAVQATETSAEAARQFNLGLEDMAAGRPLIAAERFRYVLNLDPDFPGAAEKLAEAEGRLTQATAPPTVDPATAPGELLRQAEAAIASEDWDRAISILTQLSGTRPDFQPEQVKTLFHTAYQSRGAARINADRLQEGIFDLDRAETYGELDEDAAALRVWATQYIRGSSLWGADWPTAIAIFDDLYRAAPYFHDTIFKLHGAYAAYGDQLMSVGDPCNAARQYAGANDVLKDAAIRDRQKAAEEACASITPTPGEGTPSVTPEGTLPTPEGTPPAETPTPGDAPTPTP